MAETLMDKVRDLDADLAICEAATPGPWILSSDPRYSDRLVWKSTGPGHGAVAEVRDYGADSWRENARFIAEARTGWPQAITRAQYAELQLDRLRDELRMVQDELNRLQQRGRCFD